MYELMRQHERITVTKPIDSHLIYMIAKTMEVASKEMKIKIEDMSLGGMKIVCDFDIKDPSLYTFCFVLPVFEERIYVTGEILRKLPRDGEGIEYGVRFTTKEEEKESTEDDLSRFKSYVEQLEKAG